MGKPSRQKRAYRPVTKEGRAFKRLMEAKEFYRLQLAYPPYQTTTRFAVVNGEVWIEDPYNRFSAEAARGGVSRPIETQFGPVQMIPLAVALFDAAQGYASDPNNPKRLEELQDCRLLNQTIHEQLNLC
jgi:hypothetical protein